MIQALFRRHQEYISNKNQHGYDDGSKCPQMMVTASPVLAAAIKGNFNALCASNSSGQYEMQPISISQEQDVKTMESNDPSSLIRFDSIAADTYPLITTFDAFLRMLDRSLAIPFFSSAGQSPTHDSRSQSYRSSLVDFSRFDSFYYPRLGDVTAGRRFKLDSSTLFTEIMSVIKGSIDTLSFDTGPRHLDRRQYLEMAKSRQSNLSEEERDNIFSLFEAYENRKAAIIGDYDHADFVLHVHNQLIKAPRDFGKLCSVMVDEVQDLTPTQIAILPYVCDNLDGFFFAGDTAQTIAHGVGFRFETLKDIFYSRFVRDSRTKSFRVPEVWHLKQNYRTHAQVLKIANTVVKLLLCLFPNSIDKLEDEKSIVQGPKPVFFNDTEDVISSLFDRSDINQCEFGSEQVILVRDEETQTRLRSKIGSKALVLTVLESKGMEFSDCLIFNFFSSGGCGNMWRSILSALPAFDESADSYVPKHAPFDQRLHWSLQSELKKLYVLLTRTKQNLFIFESDKQVREPIQFLWGHKKVQAVVIKSFDEDVKMILTQKSTPEQWCEKGREFRARKNHELAQQCFGREGDIVNERLSYTDVLYSRAQKQGSLLSLAERNKLLYEAGIICQEHPVQNFLNAAKLFCEAEHWKEAAECYAKLQLWKDAGHCFEKCHEILLAADMYCQAGLVHEFARICFSGELYTKCLSGLDELKPGTTIDALTIADLRGQCIKRGAIHHSLRCEEDEMMIFVRRFDEIREQRMFLKRRNKLSLLLALEEEYENSVEVAKLHEDAAHYMKASEAFEKAGNNVNAARCILKAVRLAILDEWFLPARKLGVPEAPAQKQGEKGKNKRSNKKKVPKKCDSTQKPDVFSIHLTKAMKLATGSLACTTSGEEMGYHDDVQTEIMILKQHDSLALKNYLELRSQINRPTTPFRLKLMTIQCILRNEKSVGRELDLPNLCRLAEDLIPACKQMCTILRQLQRFIFHIELANHRTMQETLLSCCDIFEVVRFDGLRNRIFLPNQNHGICQIWRQQRTNVTEDGLVEISLDDFISAVLPFFEQISQRVQKLLLETIQDSSQPCNLRLNNLVSITPIMSASEIFNSFARTLRSCLEELMLPSLSIVSDMSVLASARSEQRCLLFAPLLYSSLRYSELGISNESVARDMLLADICWDKTAAAAMTCGIMRYTIKTKFRDNGMRKLCAVFLYEALAGGQAQGSELARYFFRSLELSHEFLCARQTAAAPLSLSEIDKISPIVFLSLAEKTYVSLLICAKKFQSLLLPMTTAFDVLNRPNETYARILEHCTQESLDVSEDTSIALACSISRTVLWTLNAEYMEAWLKHWSLNNHYVFRAIFLVFTVAVNLRPNSRQRSQILVDLNEKCAQKRIKEMLLQVKPVGLNLLQLLKDLKPKNLDQKSIEVGRKSGMGQAPLSNWNPGRQDRIQQAVEPSQMRNPPSDGKGINTTKTEAATGEALVADAAELLSKFSKVCKSISNPLICVSAEPSAVRAESLGTIVQMDEYVAVCSPSASRKGIVLVPLARTIPVGKNSGLTPSLPTNAKTSHPSHGEEQSDRKLVGGLRVDATVFVPTPKESVSSTTVAETAVFHLKVGRTAESDLEFPLQSALLHYPSGLTLLFLARHGPMLSEWADRARRQVATRTSEESLAFNLESEFLHSANTMDCSTGRACREFFITRIAPLQWKVRSAIIEAEKVILEVRVAALRPGKVCNYTKLLD